MESCLFDGVREMRQRAGNGTAYRLPDKKLDFFFLYPKGVLLSLVKFLMSSSILQGRPVSSMPRDICSPFGSGRILEIDTVIGRDKYILKLGTERRAHIIQVHSGTGKVASRRGGGDTQNDFSFPQFIPPPLTGSVGRLI